MTKTVSYNNTAPVALLHECFRYDAEKGLLFWRRRPISHFRTFKAWDTFNRQFAEREAFPTIGTHGYRYGTFQHCGDYYRLLLHRTIWAFHKGYWPDEVDHKDTVRLHNQIENLREATSAQNKRNRGAQQNNKTGFKGVTGPSPSGKYIAQIRLNKRSTHLGSFDTPEAAHAAYQAAARQHYGEFARW